RARITAVADRLRATFAELVETEKHHQEVARRGAWSEKTLRQIQDTARRQATNAAELLGLVARLPEPARPSAEVRADLEMLRFEADELAEVMDGEIQYWRGDKLTPWSTVLAEMYGQAEPEALARVTPMFVMARAGSQS
ncbi:MAG: hypothetical protein J2P46_22730, partial [Zavarzinella sp.]|nr:hypothetical protein [Zavarzinella sp.]